jgi:cation diffusion facilitator family transporter
MIRPMQEKELKMAARISLFVGIIVLILKTLAFQQTKSQALLSDALESIVNVLTAMVSVWVVHFSSQPADNEHPYGHGKAEYFSAAFEGGLVGFAGMMIIVESIKALFENRNISHIQEGLGFAAVATLGNLLLSGYLYWIAKKNHSAALKASAVHIFSDILTTAGAALGLFLVWFTGKVWIDAVTAIIMALLLIRSAYMVMRNSMGALLDETDEETLTKLAQVLETHRFPGIIDIHQTRIIRAGRFHHVDAHVVVPEFWDVKETHHETVKFETAVVNEYPFDGEIVFHVDPCLQSFCANCELSDCSLRRKAYEKKKLISAKSLTEIPIVDKEEEWMKHNTHH